MKKIIFENKTKPKILEVPNKLLIHKADCEEIKQSNYPKTCIVWPNRKPHSSDNLYLEYIHKDIKNKQKQEEINFDNVSEYEPIFAKRDGKLRGMVIKEAQGWILRIDGRTGSSGHYNSLLECLKNSSILHHYTFYTDITL